MCATILKERKHKGMCDNRRALRVGINKVPFQHGQ